MITLTGMQALLLAASQLAGVGGLLLGVVNYRHNRKLREDAKNAPLRADQRRYREQLRTVLHEAVAACQTVETKLRVGDQLPVETPKQIEQAETRLGELIPVITDPDPSVVNHLKVQLLVIISAWSSARQTNAIAELGKTISETQSSTPINAAIEQANRMQSKAESSIHEKLSEFIGAAQLVINETAALDQVA